MSFCGTTADDALVVDGGGQSRVRSEEHAQVPSDDVKNHGDYLPGCRLSLKGVQ